MSHLLQMRGLKLVSSVLLELVDAVASFTDAWIETADNTEEYQPPLSHLLQMRGLKHVREYTPVDIPKSHLLQMRGLKHGLRHTFASTLMSHLLQMRGLKLPDTVILKLSNRRIFYRCVD